MLKLGFMGFHYEVWISVSRDCVSSGNLVVRVYLSMWIYIWFSWLLIVIAPPFSDFFWFLWFFNRWISTKLQIKGQDNHWRRYLWKCFSLVFTSFSSAKLARFLYQTFYTNICTTNIKSKADNTLNMWSHHRFIWMVLHQCMQKKCTKPE